MSPGWRSRLQAVVSKASSAIALVLGPIGSLGRCPVLKNGDVFFGERRVKLWLGSNAASADGPLVFYWHGTTSSPELEPAYVLTAAVIEEVLAAGGMVAAPYSEDPDGSVWSAETTSGNGVWMKADLELADQILACAIEQVGIDTRHIHTTGMSAGGLHTAAMSHARSNYIASVAPLSGGLAFWNQQPDADPDNLFAAMIVHGGSSDIVGTTAFEPLSEAYRDALLGEGRFAFMCDHGQGHWVQPSYAPHLWRFFQDHPYGVGASPYERGLPSSFPEGCSL